MLDMSIQVGFLVYQVARTSAPDIVRLQLPVSRHKRPGQCPATPRSRPMSPTVRQPHRMDCLSSCPTSGLRRVRAAQAAGRNAGHVQSGFIGPWLADQVARTGPHRTFGWTAPTSIAGALSRRACRTGRYPSSTSHMARRRPISLNSRAEAGDQGRGRGKGIG